MTTTIPNVNVNNVWRPPIRSNKNLTLSAGVAMTTIIIWQSPHRTKEVLYHYQDQKIAENHHQRIKDARRCKTKIKYHKIGSTIEAIYCYITY